VHNLVVDSELLALVGNDEHTDRARALTVRLTELVVEVALVNDLEALLDLARLGHGDELAVVTDVDETVLLEDGAEKGVEDNRGRGVRDNARLLVQLLGEEVDTEVAVLTGLGRGGDADDLAGTLLEDDQVTNADVVARNGEGGGGRSVDGGDGGGLGLLHGLETIRGGLGRVSVGGVLIVVVVLGHGVGGNWERRSVLKKGLVARKEIFKLVVLVLDVDVFVLDDDRRDRGIKGFGCSGRLVRGEGGLGFIYLVVVFMDNGVGGILR